MRVILDEWRTITGLDRKTDDALWKRYSAARDAFNRRRGSHFAELDRERAGAKQSKEQLCERAEALSTSTDWAGTAAVFREMLTEWKAAGRTALAPPVAMLRRITVRICCAGGRSLKSDGTGKADRNDPGTTLPNMSMSRPSEASMVTSDHTPRDSA